MQRVREEAIDEQPPQVAQAAELGGGTTCPQLLALEQDTAAQRSLWGQTLLDTRLQEAGETRLENPTQAKTQTWSGPAARS